MGSMYAHESNIYWIIEVYKQFFKGSNKSVAFNTIMLEFCELLTQLKIYQPYTIDRTTQRRYREEVFLVIFLKNLDT